MGIVMKRHSVLGIGADFFSGVLVGGLIGFSLDTFFETRPWLFCLFIVLGFGAGVRNVMKSVQLKDFKKPVEDASDAPNDLTDGK